MAGARNITGLLALVIVSAFKEATPLPSEVVPACRNRNIPKTGLIISNLDVFSIVFLKKEEKRMKNAFQYLEGIDLESEIWFELLGFLVGGLEEFLFLLDSVGILHGEGLDLLCAGFH